MTWTEGDWARLGDRISSARKGLGMDQKQFAEAADVSENTVSNYERGRVPVNGLVPGGYRRVERALGWGDGSVRAVLDGESLAAASPATDGANEAFASWLKAERQRSGMSQDKLAVALRNRGLSITQSQIAKVERGERGVELGLAVTVTAVFGTTPDVALGLRPPGGSQEQHLNKTLARRENFLRALAVLVDSELQSPAS